MKYGNLTIISNDVIGYNQPKVLCQCTCGRKIVTKLSLLQAGLVTSCTFSHSNGKNRPFNDLSGKIFNNLYVLHMSYPYVTKNDMHYLMYLCKCKLCGNLCAVRATKLISGRAKSCGCTRSQSNLYSNMHDLTGKHFGYWTVLHIAKHITEPRGRKVILWHCRCKCGTERDIRAGSLVGGTSLSCGCHKVEVLKQKAKKGWTESKGEQYVRMFLQQRHIYNVPQFVDLSLRSNFGYPLSFDFYVPTANKSNVLIECQGQQHYKPIDYFGGLSKFKQQQRNDQHKRIYAKNHQLELIEIPWNMDHRKIANLLNSYL